MKELYLIPKHQFEMMKNRNPKTDNSDKSNLSTHMQPTTSVKSKSTLVNKGKVHKRSVPTVGQEWGTRVLPPPLENIVPIRGVSYSHSDKPKNPNIQQYLTMKFSGRNLSHARILLNLLEK